jgi:transposase
LQAQLDLQRAQLETQKAQLEALQTQPDVLQRTIAQLEAQLAAARKDSATSSKPPSSDIVKPPKPPPLKGQDKRRIGGQPGHPKHERVLFPPEQVNGGSHDYVLDLCPHCGHGLQPTTAAPRVVQQIEIHEVPLSIEEHCGHPGWCPHCQKLRYAPLPLTIERGGLVGPRLITLIAYLKGACHASFSTIRKFLRDVVQVSISRGQLAKIIGKVSEALEQPYAGLLEDLPAQARLNIDETGHKQNGERMWTWCFRAGLYTLFKIDPTRSADVLIEVLGKEFNGVWAVTTSRPTALPARVRRVAQFCLAHLIRDVKFLTTLPDPRERAYGERLREALRRLFAVIHRRSTCLPRRSRANWRRRGRRCCGGTQEVPETKHSRDLAKRFEKHGESYFRFLTEPGVEPTNNLAEQAIRFVVLDRLVTQGTRSEAGNRWCERIWTVIATCSQQGRSVFDYLSTAVEAWLHRTEAPSLLPSKC